MKNKVINLFSKSQIIQNKGVKYSTLLEQFMEPFAHELSDMEYYEDIFEFAIHAWNFGNMKLLMPEGESEVAIDSVKDHDVNVDLLKRMIDSKVIHFREHTNFITDYEIKETSGDPILSVITQEEDAFLPNLFDAMEYQDDADDYYENFINRTAIVIKPLQPFLDWGSNLFPEKFEEIKEARTYLISEDIEDVEAWLKKKFKKIFEFELELWHSNKKEWPQRRNYKMFKEWFQTDISTMVYDFEKKPVSKFE